MDTSRKWLLIGANFSLYAVALVLPAFWYTDDAGVRAHFDGWLALLAGVLAAFMAVADLAGGTTAYLGALAWFANPLLWLSWGAIACNAPRTALLSSGAALCLAGLFLVTRTLSIPTGGRYLGIVVGVGYVAWLASIVMAGCLGAWMSKFPTSQASRSKNARHVDW